MRLHASLVVLLALFAAGYPGRDARVEANALAETLSESFAETVKENTAKVEQSGGVRQQVLHKGADLMGLTAINKGTAALAVSAAKYPALAMAAPVALPVVKVIAFGMLMNAVHHHINNLNKKPEGEALTEEERRKLEAQEARGDLASSLMDKLTGKFMKKPEEKGEANQEKAEEEEEEQKKE